MANSDNTVLIGQVVEDEISLTLDELSGVCCVARERIIELVDHGLLDATAGARFGGNALQRSRRALRLQQDLGINAAGASLVVELLERIDALEASLRSR